MPSLWCSAVVLANTCPTAVPLNDEVLGRRNPDKVDMPHTSNMRHVWVYISDGRPFFQLPTCDWGEEVGGAEGVRPNVLRYTADNENKRREDTKGNIRTDNNMRRTSE